jgi:hypothetical protein
MRVDVDCLHCCHVTVYNCLCNCDDGCFAEATQGDRLIVVCDGIICLPLCPLMSCRCGAV